MKRHLLKDTGSLVIDIGGAWISGQPTRSLYHCELLPMLCKEIGFHLAQEFFWWNPARLPTPAEWVTVRRIRVKDAVNCVWWLSKTPWPKASNRRVFVPYSDAMQTLLKVGYKAQMRSSGHDISDKFNTNNGAAIPPNLIAIAHTESNSAYMRYCAERSIKAHPARFPVDLPEYFVRMLIDAGDLVIDPFGGSCVTGEACKKLGRSWACCELVEDYLRGATGRFQQGTLFPISKGKTVPSYSISHPAALWNGSEGEALAADGGKKRRLKKWKIVASLSPGEIVDAILSAPTDSGAQAQLTSPVRSHPRKFRVIHDGSSFLLWIYIWTITHGGATRSAEEYRIQMTTVTPPLGNSPSSTRRRMPIACGWRGSPPAARSSLMRPPPMTPCWPP